MSIYIIDTKLIYMKVICHWFGSWRDSNELSRRGQDLQIENLFSAVLGIYQKIWNSINSWKSLWNLTFRSLSRCVFCVFITFLKYILKFPVTSEKQNEKVLLLKMT